MIDEFSDDNEVTTIYPYANLKLIKHYKKCREGLCFNYALKRYSTYFSCFMFEDAYKYLIKTYTPIELENLEVGDVVTYHDYEWDNFVLNCFTEYPTANNVRHYAKVVKTDGTLKGTIIRSKWGNCGIFETDLEGVPIEYGEAIVLWRKKERR